MTLLDAINTPADLRKLSVEQLPQLAAEIRKAICEQVMLSGGHLAPNLGVVELTIALHYVFDFGHDRLLFDVGHQCYPHKLLTGRRRMLSGLRTSKGMAGFPEPRESIYDLFSVGHAGTAISTAVGMARGDTLAGESYDPDTRPNGRRVVSLIGDASIVNGVAMEGLNGAGTLKRQFLVVLNDNGMSISKPQGAVAEYFNHMRLSHRYTGWKNTAKEWLKGMPGGSHIRGAYHKSTEALKHLINEAGWFEHFGLVTVGPVDGHDLPTLIRVLQEVRNVDKPMVLHVKTIKGKGFDFSENDASTFHSPPAFSVVANDPDSEPQTLVSEGCRVELKKEGRSFTAAVADIMADAMGRDDKIVAATAAMPDGTGVAKLLKMFPDRTWDTGICESHALDMMAGLAKTGFKPFLAVYCTFLQRAFDQAFQESALQGLPVRLLLDRAGLVGGDGAVHHGFCDVTLLRVLPKAAVMAAMDEPSLAAAVEFMRTYETGLSSVRYPRDNVSPRFAASCPPFVLGKARCLTPEFDLGGSGNDGAPGAEGVGGGPECAVLAFGTCAIDAAAAIDELRGDYRVAVYDARFAKPVDTDLLRALLVRRIPIVTVEDHSVVGGFGAAVLEAAQQMGLDTSLVTRLGLPDAWIFQDSRPRQKEIAGIDPPSIARAVRLAVDAATGREARTSVPS